jgi:hypothetical protein
MTEPTPRLPDNELYWKCQQGRFHKQGETCDSRRCALSAADIREIPIIYQGGEATFWLREIAAQLAELNESLRPRDCAAKEQP